MKNSGTTSAAVFVMIKERFLIDSPCSCPHLIRLHHCLHIQVRCRIRKGFPAWYNLRCVNCILVIVKKYSLERRNPLLEVFQRTHISDIQKECNSLPAMYGAYSPPVLVGNTCYGISSVKYEFNVPFRLYPGNLSPIRVFASYLKTQGSRLHLSAENC